MLRVCQQLAAEGLDATLERKYRDRVYERALDGEQEARLSPLACSTPPDGQAR